MKFFPWRFLNKLQQQFICNKIWAVFSPQRLGCCRRFVIETLHTDCIFYLKRQVLRILGEFFRNLDLSLIEFTFSMELWNDLNWKHPIEKIAVKSNESGRGKNQITFLPFSFILKYIDHYYARQTLEQL